MTTRLFLSTLVLTAFVACGGGEPPPEDPEKQSSVDDMTLGHHGKPTGLGELTLAGRKFEVARLGELVAGKEGGFEVKCVDVAADDLASLNLYVWVEDESGAQLSAPDKGSGDQTRHFHVTPKKTENPPYRVVLRLRVGDVDVRDGLPLSGHGHEHHDGPHSGVPATFSGGAVTGHLELKLHDDKGDLELWLAEDAEFAKPFDVPLATEVNVEFIDVDGRRVPMSARDHERNEDEDGNPNIRDGKTNYFVFPGRTDEDASWLVGKDFQSIVVLRFSRDGVEFASEEFVLKPHVH